MVALSKFLSATASAIGLGVTLTVTTVASTLGVLAQTTEQNIERNYGDYGGVYVVSKESMTDLMQ